MKTKSRTHKCNALGAAVLASVLVAGCFEDTSGPPSYGVYLGIIIAGEVEGVFTPTDPGPSKVGLVRPFFAGPQLTPDYISKPQPPFCVGFKFGANLPPNIVNAEAGTVQIFGTETGQFSDLSMGPMPGPASSLPGDFQCVRMKRGSTTPYECELPPVFLVYPNEPGGWLTDSSRVTIRVAGGKNVGAFSVADIHAPPPITPSSSFNLYAVDPSAVTISWEPTDAPMVMIEMLAQLMDGSEAAQILCLEPASSQSKTIPTEALALIPTPSNTVPLIIQTNLVALNVTQGTAGWGGYLVGVGRGRFGISCRTASGPCSGP